MIVDQGYGAEYVGQRHHMPHKRQLPHARLNDANSPTIRNTGRWTSERLQLTSMAGKAGGGERGRRKKR